MIDNYLVDAFGINEYNYMNKEYILQTKAIFKMEKHSQEDIVKCTEKVVRSSNIFNLTFLITEEGDFRLQKNERKRLNIKMMSVDNKSPKEIETLLTNDLSWLMEDKYLYQFVVVAFEKEGICEGYFMIHHSIMDGIGIFQVLNRCYKVLTNQQYEISDDTNNHFVKETTWTNNEIFWNERKNEYKDLIKIKTLGDLETITITFNKQEYQKLITSKKGILINALLGILRVYPLIFNDDFNQFAIDFAVNLRKGKHKKELGMFVNILPLFFDNILSKNISEATEKILKQIRSSLKHADYISNNLGETYANVMISYIDLDKAIGDVLQAHFDYAWLDTKRGPYDLAFTFLEDGDNLSIRLDYKVDRFKRFEISAYINTIKNYMLYFTDILEENPIELSEYYIDDNVNLPSKLVTINESFESQITNSFKNNLETKVIIHEKEAITYKVLFANVLKYEKYIKENYHLDDIEVIFIDGNPSIETFVLMITAIYLGKPYIFTGIKVAKETIENLKKEFKNIFFSNIINREIDYEVIPQISYELETINQEILFKKTNHNILTYFCTSGTTGEPKIIPVKRSSVYNFVHNDGNVFMSEGDISLLIASVTFDLTVDPIYRTFLKGGTLVIVDIEKIFDEAYLLNQVINSNANTLLGTPSALLGISDQVYQKLDKVGGVGEVLTKSLVHRLSKFKNLKIYNCYGPTEATCYCNVVELTNQNFDDDDKEIPIGQLINNMEAYIVDPFDYPVHHGIKGELVLSGEGVLDNYYNYIGDEKVFCEIDGKQFYKTGDICYYRDEQFYYVGRIGRQVKISGYRIELAAIEDKLQKYFKKLFKVLVINNMLIVFYEEEINSTLIIQDLALQLPSYMIPYKYFRMDNLPINKNQKIAIGSLETMYKEAIEQEKDEELTVLEKEVFNVFSQVLEMSNFSKEDDLYAIGGNSLAAIRISTILKQTYQVIQFDTIMRLQSVKKIAEFIETQKTNETKYQFTYEFKEVYEATDMQKSMIIKYLMNKQDTSYIIGGLIEYQSAASKMSQIIDNIKSNLDFQYLALYDKGRFYLSFNHNFKIEQKVIKIADLNQLHNYIEPFDIFNDSLVRFSNIYINNQLQYILFEMHHLISDGISIHKILDSIDNKVNNKQIYFYEANQYIDYQAKLINKDQQDQYINKFKQAKPTKFLINKKDNTVQIESTFIKEEYSKLKLLQTKLKTTIQAIFSVLIIETMVEQDYLEATNQHIVATPASLRDLDELNNVVGPLINMTPYVVSINQGEEGYIRTQESIIDSIRNKYISYEEIVLQVKKELFQVVITSFNEYGINQGIKLKEDIALYPEKFGCSVFIYETNEYYRLVIVSNYFNNDEIDMLLKAIKEKINKKR